jgi:AcrR family transcriptional regulator
MPPKQQYTKERIIEAAFEVLRREGPDAITARRIADEINSSVGPIYSYFENIDDLKSAAFLKATDLMEEYAKRNWSEIPFLNMGVGFVCFARDEPVLFNTCCREGPREIKGTKMSPRILEYIREDRQMREFSEEDLASIYLKLSLLAYGMAALASQKALGNDSNENIIRILREAGGDIMFMTKARKILKDPESTDDDLKDLWRYIDE